MEFDYKKPSLEILTLIYNTSNNKQESKEELKKYVIENEMIGIYEMLSQKKIFKYEEKEFNSIKEKNNKKLKELSDLKLKDPENENHVLQVDKYIAEYYASILDTENAYNLMSEIHERSSSTSQTMDMYLCKIRISMIIKDEKSLKDNIELAKDLSEKGCDWDRRNKFKVYEALYCLINKDFRRSAELFHESLPTFESPELLSYNEAVLYTIFTGLLSFPRDALKTKILQSSEVLEGIPGNNDAYNLAYSLYNCKYNFLFVELYTFVDLILKNVYLNKMCDLFVNELKIRAYSQLLESYQSLSLESMALIFNISIDLLEKDLTKYIVEQRVSCIIDRVNMLVFVCDVKDGQRMNLIEKGDSIVRDIKKHLR